MTARGRVLVSWTDSHHAQVEAEVWQAYQDGYWAACADIAARHVELDRAGPWRDIGQRTADNLLAQRLAQMETSAARAGVDGAAYLARTREHDRAVMAAAGIRGVR